MITPTNAPEWRTAEWFNTTTPLSLASLRGKVVLAVAFQMLCPGCVSQGLPQAQRVREAFPEQEIAVIGLHTVFEHHEAMTPVSLKAFLHEYRVTFPVGVDEPDPNGPIPRTMRAYEMRGTPTTLLFDREGRLQRQVFGHLPDLQLGAELMKLIGDSDERLRQG
jgi:peroxiredoxin